MKKRRRLFFIICILTALLCACQQTALPPRKPSSRPPLEETAKKLLEQDQEAIDIFINLSLLDYIDPTGFNPDTALEMDYMPLTGTKYETYSALSALLKNTYASPSLINRYLNYPTFGRRLFENRDGKTYMCPHYLEGFDSWADLSTLKVVRTSAHTARLSVSILEGNGIQSASLLMAEHNGVWTLTDSLYFYSQEQTSAQDAGRLASWAENPLLDSKQNTGSLKNLNGSLLIVNVFLSDDISSWKDGDVQKPLSFLKTAASYLEKEAQNYGAALKIDCTQAENSYYMQYPDTIPASPEDISWINPYFSNTEYGSVSALLELASAGQDYDNVCVLFHVNKEGRSYSIPYDEKKADADSFYAERAVLFYATEHTYPYYITASTYAHELLHLAGAVDLYYHTDDRDIRKQIIIDYFPYEIMLSVPDDIQTASISAFTAFRIGWLSTLPEQLLPFQEESS